MRSVRRKFSLTNGFKLMILVPSFRSRNRSDNLSFNAGVNA